MPIISNPNDNKVIIIRTKDPTEQSVPVRPTSLKSSCALAPGLYRPRRHRLLIEILHQRLAMRNRQVG